MDHKVIDLHTGETVMTTIHLWPNDTGECTGCGEWRVLNHTIGYYCGFTKDDIGSVSTEYRSTDGKPAIVGGMMVCKGCHDDFYALSER